MSGHLIVNPSVFTHADQLAFLQERVATLRGWPHPDGVRWIVPVEAPTTTRGMWVRKGLPEGSVVVAT